MMKQLNALFLFDKIINMIFFLRICPIHFVFEIY